MILHIILLCSGWLLIGFVSVLIFNLTLYIFTDEYKDVSYIKIKNLHLLFTLFGPIFTLTATYLGIANIWGKIEDITIWRKKK